MKKTSTADLTDTLRNLLAEGGSTHTQAELMESLLEAGFSVNQSKISRLLRKIGATKTVNQTGLAVYRLPWEPGPPSTQAALSHLVIEIVRNENLVLVRTSPGGAAVIARLIDHTAEELNVLGSVAGDDTVLVVPRSIKTIQDTFEAIKAKLFL